MTPPTIESATGIAVPTRRPLILVTSFEPFGGSPLNPTMRIAELLSAMSTSHGSWVFVTLPVVSGVSGDSAWARLEPLLESLAPDAVVALGESAKADAITFERIAINLRDARMADNSGAQLVDMPVVDGAPDGRFSTLPLRAMRAACDAAGVPATLSLSAGSFLCNEVMFRLLERGVPAATGFIHVPQLPEQALARGGPSMNAETSARGIHAALESLVMTLVNSAATERAANDPAGMRA
ncbi:MAG: pyroglutamyl-peptidase I [bacterium]